MGTAAGMDELLALLRAFANLRNFATGADEPPMLARISTSRWADEAPDLLFTLLRPN